MKFRMETLETFSDTEKVARTYRCVVCDYITSRKNNYRKHLLTRKHQKSSNGNIGNAKNVASKKDVCSYTTNASNKNFINFFASQSSGRKSSKSSKKVAKYYNCSWCNKYYKSRSGCYKHETRCKGKITDEKLSELEKKVLLLEQNQKENTIVTQNNIINNNITIQLFLDKNCGNAMPLDSFVKNLQISMDDLFKTNQIGYANGLGSIIVKNLQELEFAQRPIHCSDPEKFKFYVKYDKEWKKDNGEIVGKAVENVRKEANTTVVEYVKNQNDVPEKDMMEIMKIIQSLNKIPPNMQEQNLIIKKIGSSVVLDESFNEINTIE